MQQSNLTPSEATESLNINGMQGRMLCLPPTTGREREILVVYDRYSTLERWWGLAQELQRYGTVTMPDLPGFGGMQSFYKMGEKPSLDRLADYLATFIKFRFRHKQLTVIGLGFGFVVVTRMLQRYPQLRKKVVLLISIEGYAHGSALTMARGQRRRRMMVARLFSWRLPALFYRHVMTNPSLLRVAYAANPRALRAPRGADPEIRRQLTNFRIHVLRQCEPRTAMITERERLKLNNCTVQLSRSVWHVSPKVLPYMDVDANLQQLQVAFDELQYLPSKASIKQQIIVPDKQFARPLLPAALRRELASPIA